MKILYVVQHQDTFFRCSKLSSVFASFGALVEVVHLDFNALDNSVEGPVPVKETLLSYLQKFGRELNIVVLDSPQTLLFARRFLNLFCPQARIVCNFRAGPYLEFISQSKDLKNESLQFLREVHSIILSGDKEREYCTELGLPSKLFVQIKTPIDSLDVPRFSSSDAISFIGDFAHIETNSRFKKAFEQISIISSSRSLALNFCVEGYNIEISGLKVPEKSKRPKIRVFVSDAKNYDNSLVLKSFSEEVIVIASDPAVFGLGIKSDFEYLAANHPRTITEKLVMILDDRELQKKILGNAKKFIEREHGIESTRKVVHKIMEEEKFA